MQCCTMEICSNLQIGKTIIVMHYAMLLDHLNEKEELKRKKKKKSPDWHTRKFRQNNSRHPTKQLRKKKLHEFGFQLAPCFLYFPGLVPSDLFFFANLKMGLSRRKLSPSEDAITAVIVHISPHTTIPIFVMGESSAQLLMETALTKINIFRRRC